MLKLNRFKILLSFILVILATSGFSCKLIPTGKVPKNLTQTTELSYWGVWDNPDDLQPLIVDFKALHPNINITYKKFRLAEYKQKLLEAWAIDKGPDIYAIPAAWLREYQSYVTPQPEQIQLAFRVVKKTLGKTEESTEVRSVPIFRPSDIKNQFAEVVYEDAVMDGKVYGLPFSLDSLALFYNRDLLDAAGVAEPPKNWNEVLEAVKKITRKDNRNNILTSGVAMGTAKNVAHAEDLLSLIMMQVGATMTLENGLAAFDQPDKDNREKVPALDALRFYADFANSVKEVYSWNSAQPNSLDAFVSGKLAMMFGYSYDLPIIKGRAPKLNLGVSNMAQLAGASKPANITNYWVQTVSHKTKNPIAAWGFLNFAAGKEEITKYLDKTGQPSAIRSLITAQLDIPEIGVFASQVLTAKRWYKGKDSNKMEELMARLIEEYPLSAKPHDLLKQTVEKINQTY